jgi:hypothetical protein
LVKNATGSTPPIARPVIRSATTRSVVAACAAESPQIRVTKAAITTIMTIPRRKPFLSCRRAVIVDVDKFRIGDNGRKLDRACQHPVKAATMILLSRGFCMTIASRLAALMLAAMTLWTVTLWTAPASAQPASQGRGTYASEELVGAGHKFFGNVSRGLASVIERAVSQWGLPNGYILGEEGSGAFVAGLRYGEGTLYTKNAGDLKVYWQGPSVGFDWGGDGARTMTLVYNLPSTNAIYQRFAGIDGSAYIVGGFGMTALTANDIVLVPIRSGLGLRLGASIGYLKFTPRATWNPF